MAEHSVSRATLAFLALSQFVVRTYGHVWHGIRVRGQEHVPRSGGLIVACNHQSHLDPPFVGAFSPRPVHFLAKEELFQVPVLKWIVSAMGMVSTPRDGGAIAAVRAGLRVIKGGYVLGVFPEGTRSKDGSRLPADPGIVSLAVLAGGVPIVPCLIEGSNAAMPPGSKGPKFRHPVRITYGPAFTLTQEESNLKDKEGTRATAERIMDRIFALGSDV